MMMMMVFVMMIKSDVIADHVIACTFEFNVSNMLSQQR